MIILGAASSWYRRVKAGQSRVFNLVELCGEMAVSGLVGYTGFSLALWYGANLHVAAAAAGICAHFATRLLFSAEGLLEVGVKAVSKKIEEKIK